MDFFERAFVSLNGRNYLKFIPDKMCLQILYYIHFHKRLNFDNPVTFNEKLQWLKLYDRKPEYSMLVDKYEAKKYIADKIGEEYIIPTLGIWNCFDDINFDVLPNQFVLKCTHDSGGVVVCKNKSGFDIELARKKINASLRYNYYWAGREWPYKYIKPRIIVEKYIEESNTSDLKDYKIYNFNGEPKIINVCSGRFSKSGLKQDYYSVDWEHLELEDGSFPNSFVKNARPINLQEMLKLSCELSNGLPFIRTDFYMIDDKIYFGELTFYPASGFKLFKPEKWDEILGKWISLPSSITTN